VADALDAVKNEQFVVCAGSIYLIGEVVERLRLCGAPGRDEKQLNEWSTPAAMPQIAVSP